MSPINPTIHFAQEKVEPLYSIQGGMSELNFMPNIVVTKGTVLGQVSSVNADEIQTLNFSGAPLVPTGGSFTLSIIGVDGSTTYTTAALAWNISNANLKIAVDALLDSAGYDGATVTVGGGPAPADATLTFGGTAEHWDMPALTATSSLTVAAAVAASLDVNPAGANDALTYTAVTPGTGGNAITVAYVDPAADGAALGVVVAGNDITVNLATDSDVAADLETALVGNDNDLAFTAQTPGTGGNAITITYADPGGNDQLLGVAVAGNDITVNLATGAGGAITSTALQVKGAIENDVAANALVDVALKGADTGAGVVTALAQTPLAGGSDGGTITSTAAQIAAVLATVTSAAAAGVLAITAAI